MSSVPHLVVAFALGFFTLGALWRWSDSTAAWRRACAWRARHSSAADFDPGQMTPSQRVVLADLVNRIVWSIDAQREPDLILDIRDPLSTAEWRAARAFFDGTSWNVERAGHAGVYVAAHRSASQRTAA